MPAGCFLWFGDSLISGFAVLAALMLGAALILPMFLEFMLSLGQRYARTVSVWFWARQPPATVRAVARLMALLLALSINVGVSTMVESFTFLVWLDGRLAADVCVAPPTTPSDRDQGPGCASAPRSRRSCPAAARYATGGAPIEVLGLPDHATYRDNWPLLQSARMPGSSFVPAMRPSSANNWRGACIFPSATASRCPRQAETGRSTWSASMPTTATPRARSR